MTALVPVLVAFLPAADLSVLQAFAGEPSVRELQRAAARVAEVSPERARSWLRRARTAAALPTVRARFGRGLTELTRDSSGRMAYVNTDNWRYEIDVSWSLDRLVFDRNELRASREAQRLASHREDLLMNVAQLYYARRRLQVDALLQPESDGAIDRALEIDELTAILDGMTDNALGGGKK